MAKTEVRGVKPDPRGNGKWIAIIPDPFDGTPNSRKFSFDSVDDAERIKANVKATVKAIQSDTYQVPDNVADIVKWLASEKREGYRKGNGQAITTLKGLQDKYLEGRKKRVEKGLLSHAQYNQDEWFLNFFVSYFQNDGISVADALSADSLDEFKLHVETHFDSGVSQKHAVRTVKALIEWAFETERLKKLPRNLRRFRKVKVDEAKPDTMPLSDVVKLFNAATEQMQLCVLLALNCGYTQIDIATLEHSMIDWESGEINRSRHKTQKTANTPQHSKLWPRTLELLKKQASDPANSPLVLLSSNGLALVRPDQKTDNVQRAFNRLKNKTKIKNSFRDLRSTGASLIKNNYTPATVRTKTNQELFDLYLAHKPPTMNRPYDAGDFTEMFDATDWLGDELEKAFEAEKEEKADD